MNDSCVCSLLQYLRCALSTSRPITQSFGHQIYDLGVDGIRQHCSMQDCLDLMRVNDPATSSDEAALSVYIQPCSATSRGDTATQKRRSSGSCMYKIDGCSSHCLPALNRANYCAKILLVMYFVKQYHCERTPALDYHSELVTVRQTAAMHCL